MATYVPYKDLTCRNHHIPLLSAQIRVIWIRIGRDGNRRELPVLAFVGFDRTAPSRIRSQLFIREPSIGSSRPPRPYRRAAQLQRLRDINTTFSRKTSHTPPAEGWGSTHRGETVKPPTPPRDGDSPLPPHRGAKCIVQSAQGVKPHLQRVSQR